MAKTKTAISSAIIALALIAATAPSPSFAMGPPGSDCINRYDGEVVSMLINNGTSTFDVVRNNITKFDARTTGGYSATVTIEFPAASSEGNSELGQYWLWTDAFGVRYGNCYDGATAGGKVIQTFEVTEDDLYPNSVLAPYYLEGGIQKVGVVTHWDGNVDSNQDAAYSVRWIITTNATEVSDDNNGTATTQEEQPGAVKPPPETMQQMLPPSSQDTDEESATQQPSTNNSNMSVTNKVTATTTTIVNKPITITNVENNNVVINNNNVKVNQQVRLSTEVSAPEAQTASEQQPVMVLIEIRDREGYTIFLESRNNVVVEDSEPVQLVWTPREPGSYETRVFTVDDLERPSAFSVVSVSQFSVAE